MADSRKANFTYRVNTKTPREVEEWLATKPDELSYPEFVNAAIMVARAKDDGSELNLDSITSSLADMVSAGGAGQRTNGSGISVSPADVAEAIVPIVSKDGEATRSHIDEVADRIGEQIESIARVNDAMAPVATDDASVLGLEPVNDQEPAPSVDAEEIARSVSETVTEAVTETMSNSVSDVVKEDGELTRDAVANLAGSMGKVSDDVSSILEALQSATLPHDAEGVATEVTDANETETPNVILDGQLTEEDLNFAVQRIKDTIRTDGQKTRNAIITKMEQVDQSMSDQIKEVGNAVATKAGKDDMPQGITADDMQTIADAIRQSNDAMLQAIDERIAAIQQAEAQGSRDIVFDEATTAFFKRIHRSVSSILIRVDAMQAQLEHVQKIVERNGNTLKTMSRGGDVMTNIGGMRSVISGQSQFGDTSMFVNSPEIEETEEELASSWNGDWESHDEQGSHEQTEAEGMPTLQEPASDKSVEEEPAKTSSDAPAATEPAEIPSDMPVIASDDAPVVARAEQPTMVARTETGVPFKFDSGPVNGNALLASLLISHAEEATDSQVDKSDEDAGKTVLPEAYAQEPKKSHRIVVPKRRRGHGIQEDGEGKPIASDGQVASDVTVADADNDVADIMQPTGPIPVSSPSAESVESIIDGLDFGNVASVASDPDELLTDTLQSLLG